MKQWKYAVQLMHTIHINNSLIMVYQMFCIHAQPPCQSSLKLLYTTVWPMLTWHITQVNTELIRSKLPSTHALLTDVFCFVFILRKIPFNGSENNHMQAKFRFHSKMARMYFASVRLVCGNFWLAWHAWHSNPWLNDLVGTVHMHKCVSIMLTVCIIVTSIFSECVWYWYSFSIQELMHSSQAWWRFIL